MVLVSDEIYMTLDGYNTYSSTKSLGIVMMSFLDVVQRIKPDWILLAGDREKLWKADSCSLYKYPIDSHSGWRIIRKYWWSSKTCNWKICTYSFASNKDAANRLKKLGEENFRIKTVGAPQLDDIHKNLKEFNDIKKLLKGYGLDKIKNYSLIIFHPVVE